MSELSVQDQAQEIAGDIYYGTRFLIEKVDELEKLTDRAAQAMATYVPVPGEDPPKWYRLLDGVVENPNKTTVGELVALIRGGTLSEEQRKQAISSLFYAHYSHLYQEGFEFLHSGEKWQFIGYDMEDTPKPQFRLSAYRWLGDKWSSRPTRLKTLPRIIEPEKEV
ncbi:MAG: hypothetical protein NXI13_16350 [Proteobacteria bacterium]|nr:hypothetical protein [Pseudomonadota bacterium]